MKIQILYIGRHAEILATVLRLINQNDDWQAFGAGTDEEAILLFKQRRYNLVLFGSGIAEDSENKLRSFFCAHQPDIRIVQHYGGGSGLLGNEIREALER
ncbi:MAG: hypothetical protein JWO58_1223 [Chitinophagaceae bacterium]|nr:hypothetical protein [Chitinophagaceae bacterium]